MYQVGIKNRFRASHFLVGDFGEETVPHGHEYVVEWICSTNVLDENGFSMDIALMEELLQRTADRVRGKRLNDLDFFKERQVSVENLAHYIHQDLFAALEDRGYPLGSIQESRIRIWESETAWAAYIYA